jgi:hypothetical protein
VYHPLEPLDFRLRGLDMARIYPLAGLAKHELCLNLPEGRLVESYPTVVIPLYKGIVFVRLLNCSEFSSRLSEVAQAHDTISGS